MDRQLCLEWIHALLLSVDRLKTSLTVHTVCILKKFVFLKFYLFWSTYPLLHNHQKNFSQSSESSRTKKVLHTIVFKVIIHKSRGEHFLWNRIEIWSGFGPVGNTEKLGGLWATFEGSFSMFSRAKKYFNIF